VTKKVELEGDVRAVTETKVGEHGNASVGFASGLRPAAQVSAGVSKEEASISEDGKFTTTTSSVDARAQVAVGQSPRIDLAAKVNIVQVDPNKLDHAIVVNAGVRVSSNLGSSPEVVAAVRGDYERDGLNKLSPYFKATASSHGGRNIEVGACTTPGHELSAIQFPRVCAGVNVDQNGSARVAVSTGFSF